MTVRTNVTAVTFAYAVVLRGLDEVLPAGTYRIETDEERVEGPSFPVYRRLRTVMQIPGAEDRPGSTRSILIEPDDLDAAVARDSAASPTDAQSPDCVSAPAVAASAAAGAGDRSEADRSQMDAYGITRVPTDYFHVGAYRYTSLKDAVAQAERDVRRG